MWMNKTDDGYYTVHYCPWCKLQRFFKTINGLWLCDRCGNKMKYNQRDGKLHLI